MIFLSCCIWSILRRGARKSSIADTHVPQIRCAGDTAVLELGCLMASYSRLADVERATHLDRRGAGLEAGFAPMRTCKSQSLPVIDVKSGTVRHGQGNDSSIRGVSASWMVALDSRAVAPPLLAPLID